MINDKKLQNFNNLQNLCEKGINESLTEDDIDGLTLHGKCYVINGLASALKNKVPQKNHGTGKYTRQSLLIIAESFQPSDQLLGLQFRKRNMFLNAMSKPENSEVLDILKDWNNRDISEKESAIIHTAKLHQKVYLTGIASLLSIEHVFVEPVNTSPNKIKLGGFISNLDKSSGIITQLGSDLTHSRTPILPLHTAHHEATHAIQFSLASAFHHGNIRPDHILFNDARTFHALEINKANIPFAILKAQDTRAYSSQIHEQLAENEGRLISHDLFELANS